MDPNRASSRTLPAALAGILALLAIISTTAIYQNLSLLQWRRTHNAMPLATFEIYALSSEPRQLSYLPPLLQPEFNNYLSIISAMSCLISSMYTIRSYTSNNPSPQMKSLLALSAALVVTTITTTWTSLIHYFTPPLTQAELLSLSQPVNQSTAISTSALSRPLDLEIWSCGLAAQSTSFTLWHSWHEVCRYAQNARWCTQALLLVLVAAMILTAMHSDREREKYDKQRIGKLEMLLLPSEHEQKCSEKGQRS